MSKLFEDGIPNPGSQEAIDKGCVCPVLDNHYGKGREFSSGEVYWVITVACDLHNVDVDYATDVKTQNTKELCGND